MSLFDAPSRESSCVQRSRTSTSLQSLALLNETQRLEASRKLAERLILHADEDTARFIICLNYLPHENQNRSKSMPFLNYSKIQRLAILRIPAMR